MLKEMKRPNKRLLKKETAPLKRMKTTESISVSSRTMNSTVMETSCSLTEASTRVDSRKERCMARACSCLKMEQRCLAFGKMVIRSKLSTPWTCMSLRMGRKVKKEMLRQRRQHQKYLKRKPLTKKLLTLQRLNKWRSRRRNPKRASKPSPHPS